MEFVAVADPALRCDGITVRYGDFVALQDVSVAFERGKIHAVVGQNGAGKTTFARVAAGLISAAVGQVSVDNRLIGSGKVRDARQAGVELVHQSFALPPSFTIAEAMEFGATRHSATFTRKQLNSRWQDHLRALDVQADPRTRIRDLPVETQQGVEIARALTSDASVLILDEPTAVLSPSGIEKLFERLRSLKAKGVTVIVILHKIREVLAVADTVTVLRNGKLVAASVPRAEIDASTLAEFIIGAGILQTVDGDDASAIMGADRIEHSNSSRAASGSATLVLAGVSTVAEPEAPPLSNLSLSIRPGEIVGVAGVEGNGQRTLVQTIAGLTSVSQGEVRLWERSVTNTNLDQRRGLGLRIIPFERNSEGLSLSSSLWENWSPAKLLRKRLFSLVKPGLLQREAVSAFLTWSVKFNTPTQPAGSLSGGNAQKLIFSREIDPDARLIIAAQPTRGLDIGATAFVWKALRDAKEGGCSILLISSDLDELFDISDRVIVMLSGKIVGEFAAPYDMGAVGAAMTGGGR